MTYHAMDPRVVQYTHVSLQKDPTTVSVSTAPNYQTILVPHVMEMLRANPLMKDCGNASHLMIHLCVMMVLYAPSIRALPTDANSRQTTVLAPSYNIATKLLDACPHRATWAQTTEKSVPLE